MARRISWALAVALCGTITAGVATAGSTYIALGDSLTFGETDLIYRQSYGDRGYVSLVADSLAGQNGGVRPNVINLAIDGETSASFTTASGRVPPVTGRTDAILANENLNYAGATGVSQATMFQQMVASQKAMGNTVSTVSITMGDNDLFTLFNSAGFTPGSAVDPMLASTLATYKTNFTGIMSLIRGLLPNATIDVVGGYNPFPADPTNTFGPLAASAGVQFNNTAQSIAAQFGARFIDTATPFMGHEVAYTYQAGLPQNSVVGGTYGGSLPLGDVHPNALGYSVIANAITVPEPSSLVLFGLGVSVTLGHTARRLRRLEQAA